MRRARDDGEANLAGDKSLDKDVIDALHDIPRSVERGLRFLKVGQVDELDLLRASKPNGDGTPEQNRT